MTSLISVKFNGISLPYYYAVVTMIHPKKKPHPGKDGAFDQPKTGN